MNQNFFVPIIFRLQQKYSDINQNTFRKSNGKENLNKYITFSREIPLQNNTRTDQALIHKASPSKTHPPLQQGLEIIMPDVRELFYLFHSFSNTNQF